ncbi:MAG: AraC family transcriptional regulator [Dysgonamonadaceae bacterium]|jgi:AraC-like DNA-binding protein|nr:AraC family transcriptional regulator [Dysgonamonadaceae bacterium]
MSIFYLDEHTACGNYISDYTVGFKNYHIPQGDYFVPANKEHHYLFFVSKGRAELHYESKVYSLKKDMVCFIPISSDYKLYAETDTNIIINYFNKPIDLCEKLALENLNAYVDQKVHIPILKVNQPMKKFLSSLTFYINEGIFCKHFHEIKQKELFCIFRYFYSKKEIAGLFAPIISKNIDFKNMVLSNYLHACSVKELANICNYSLSSFNRIFKKNFNENPYTWLQNQKLKYITGKLSDKNIPLGQIIDEFRFSSPSHFTIFCKKHLHVTPSQFRKQYIK